MLMTIGKQIRGDVVITSDAPIRHWLIISWQIISDVTISKFRFSIDFDSIFSPK